MKREDLNVILSGERFKSNMLHLSHLQQEASHPLNQHPLLLDKMLVVEHVRDPVMPVPQR